MKIHQLPGQVQPDSLQPNRRTEGFQQGSFASVLQSKLSQSAGSLKFSAHAIDRLVSRKVRLSSQDISRLQHAVHQLEQKGGNESLVLMGDLALVVSVKNNTVITAVNRSPNDEAKIFTNIDSALIL
ncbi:MAG: TIGR02530 family flagellar biosynthesis protein [bacterium]